MKIFLNDNELDVTLENEKTVGEVLSALEAECENNDATIIMIEVDGTEYPAEKIDELYARSIDSAETVSVHTISVSDIATRFKELLPLIAKLCAGFENVPLLLQTGKEKEVSALLEAFANMFDNMCHVISLSALFPEKFAAFEADGDPIAKFMNQFAPFLQELTDALESKDMVLVGDLTEYELKPRLETLYKSISEAEF